MRATKESHRKMKHASLFSVVAVLGLGVLACSPTASLAAPLTSNRVARVRAAIEKVYHDEDVATMRGDVNAAMSYYAKTYTVVLPTGQTSTYEAMKKDIKPLLEQTRPRQRSLRSNSKIITFKLNGANEAQAKTKSESVQTLVDPMTQQTIIVASYSTTLDNFVRQSGHWVHQKSVVLASRVTNNGRVVRQ